VFCALAGNPLIATNIAGRRARPLTRSITVTSVERTVLNLSGYTPYPPDQGQPFHNRDAD
jgi:hypothetical protein